MGILGDDELFAFWQGKQNRNGPSRNPSGTPGANSRHHPVASQSFHEQVPHAGFYRLHGQRRTGVLTVNNGLLSVILSE